MKRIDGRTEEELEEIRKRFGYMDPMETASRPTLKRCKTKREAEELERKYHNKWLCYKLIPWGPLWPSYGSEVY